jgi:hypothetical protein
MTALPTPGPPDPPGIADRVRMFGMLSAPWVAQACYALAKEGVPDLLAAGPRPIAELAAESGTDQRALQRMIRALCGAGVFSEVAPDCYQLTALGQLLRTGVSRSSRDAAVMFGEEVFRSFAEIGYTLRTGKPAFEKVYGKPFYDYLADNPDAARTFASAMGDGPVPAALATCDLAGVRTIVDVGGGNGGLLAKVLRAQPQASGVLVDLGPAISQARQRLAEAGLADRVDFVERSFFEHVPAGADVYVLSRVLHNWDDADALTILRQVRTAVPAHGRLLVFEGLIDRTDHVDTTPAAALTMDLLILLMLSGCDRTQAEYADLFGRAGFEVRQVRAAPVRARQAESVIEAVPR